MPQYTFTKNEVWETNIKFHLDLPKKVLKYSGDLDGGTLSISSRSEDIITPLPDGKLNITKTDSNDDPIQEVVFLTTGEIIVELTGAGSPNVKVVVE